MKYYGTTKVLKWADMLGYSIDRVVGVSGYKLGYLIKRNGMKKPIECRTVNDLFEHIRPELMKKGILEEDD